MMSAGRYLDIIRVIRFFVHFVFVFPPRNAVDGWDGSPASLVRRTLNPPIVGFTAKSTPPAGIRHSFIRVPFVDGSHSSFPGGLGPPQQYPIFVATQWCFVIPGAGAAMNATTDQRAPFRRAPTFSRIL